MGPEAINAIRHGLEGTNEPQWMWLVVGLASALICVLLVHVLVLQLRRNRRLVRQWQGFVNSVSDLGLTDAEMALLKDLARKEAPYTPTDVVRRIEAFERAVDSYLKPLCSARGARKGAQSVAERIRAVRRKLGFQGGPGVIYYSTRELRPGQEVRLTFPEDPHRPGVRGRASQVREDFLTLSELDPADGALRGSSVQVLFFSHGRAYGFASVVVELDVAGGSCLLLHSADVSRAGVRESHRVDVNQPVVFRSEEEKPDVQREGILRDLSAGGLALEGAPYYHAGHILVLRISPSRWLGGRTGAAGELQDRELRGIVLSARQVEEGTCLYHVEFRALQDDDASYLFRLVNMLEFQARRAGSTE